jgi:hypothetical protein
MKRFKTTWIFAVIVIAFCAYVFWDFTEQKKKDTLDPGEVRLTEFSIGDVKSLTLTKENTPIQIDRSDKVCRITAPLQDLCDVVSVEGVLTAISPMSGRQVVKAAELKPEEDYGLSDPKATEISWELKNGGKSQIKIGTKNSFDGGFYVLKDGVVYVVDRSVGQASNKGLEQLRSKTLLPLTLEDVVKISSDSFHFEKQGEGWAFAKKQTYPVAAEKVEDWWEDFKRLKATKVTDEKPKLSTKPAEHFSLTAKDGVHSVDFYRQGKDLYVATESSQKKYFEIPESRLKNLLVGASHFYDGKAPFQFPLERVSRAELTVAGKTTVFLKKEKKWESKDPLNEEALTSFFHKLSQLEAKSFDGPAKARFSAKDQLRLLDSSKKLVFGLQWGDKFGKENLQAVRVTGKPEIFGVSESQLKELLAVDFFSKPAPTKESSSEKNPS